MAMAVGRLSCRQARSPATPTSGITAETTKTVPNPDTEAIWPETNEPVMTPKSVKAQNVAIAVPRSAGPAIDRERLERGLGGREADPHGHPGEDERLGAGGA